MEKTSQTYVNRIRNVAKRGYAIRYRAFLLSKTKYPVESADLPEPTWTGLSTMGAQAVRLRLAEIVKEGT